jgi:cell division protein FtsB
MGKRKKKIQKVLIVSIFFIALSLFLYDIFLGNMGLLEYFSLKKRYEILEEKKTNVSRDIKSMEKEKENLNHNLNYIEEIARKDLGLIKEREKIIILEDEPPKAHEGADKGND